MPKYLVETVSMFRIRYVIECENVDHAMDSVACNEPEGEVSQEHIGENIISAREISDEEYLKLFDEDNSYLKGLNVEEKYNFIHKINYDE